MSRSSATAVADDPTPEPRSAVTASAREHFADPTPEMLALEVAIGAAYEEGRALYGDEDGDAWLAALESGAHPLCRVRKATECCTRAPGDWGEGRAARRERRGARRDRRDA
ncbi:MAG: hypothetical protein U0359_09210 [Byssovorax sp.]